MKQPPVTAAEIDEFLDSFVDADDFARGLCDRVLAGKIEPGASSIRAASQLLHRSRALADLASQLLYQLRKEETLTAISETLKPRDT